MAWAAINASGEVVAVAKTQAALVVPTGGSVVQATHPVAEGFTYAGGTFAGRTAALRPGRRLLAELPSLVRARVESIRFSTFAATSLNSVRIYLDHLTSTVNCVLIPVNRTNKDVVEVLRAELHLSPNEWILRQSGFGVGVASTTYYRTVIPADDDGTGNWTRISTTFAVAPRTYNSRADLARAYLL